MIEDCKAVPMEALELALSIHRRTSNFFPTISELRRIIYQPAIDAIPLTADAWGEVRRAVTMLGRDGYPAQWSHPLIGRACTKEFWRDYCNSMEDTAMTYQAHFLRMYNQLREREVLAILEGREVYRPAEKTGMAVLPKLELKGMD